MASSVESDGSVVPVLDVKLGGRRFPARWDGLSKSTAVAFPLHEASPAAELADELREALWRRLPWRETRADERDRMALVEAYLQSVAELDRCRSQIVEMIRVVCEVNLEFLQAAGATYARARDRAVRTKLDAMLEPTRPFVEPIRNVVDTTTAAQPVESVRETFQAALETAVDELVRKFSTMLARFVDRRLFGLVEWLPNHCCRYHFFRQVLVQENDGRFVEVDETIFRHAPEYGRRMDEWIVRRRTYQSAVCGRHFHRLTRHRHDVMNAVRTTIRNSRVVMPPPMERLVAAIPDWLRPLVRIIDGEIFHEQVIEQDLKSEGWADHNIVYESITQPVEPIIARDESASGPAPGVVIGPYVLTGWGPREVEAELDQRRLAEEASIKDAAVLRASRYAGPLALVAVVVTLVTLVVGVQAVWGRENAFLIAAAGTLVALGLYWQSAHDYFLAQREPSAQHLAYCYAFAYGGLLLLAEWCLFRFITPVSWLIPLFLIAVVGTAFSLANLFRGL